MSGILNNKHRILDTFITDYGRAQAAAGEMRFRFYSFTDKHAFYEASGSLPVVADDATDRIYFEASDDHQDKICLETDFNARVAEDFGVLMGSASPIVIDAEGFEYFGQDALDTQSISNIANGVVGNTISNFEGQRFLKTIEPLVALTDREFDIYPHKFEFVVSNGMLDSSPVKPKVLDGIVPMKTDISEFPFLWQDYHFDHLPNFRKLEPINKLPTNVEYSQVYPYISAGVPLSQYSISDIALLLNALELHGGDHVAALKGIQDQAVVDFLAEYQGAGAGPIASVVGQMAYSSFESLHGDLFQFINSDDFNGEMLKIAARAQMAVYDDEFETSSYKWLAATKAEDIMNGAYVKAEGGSDNQENYANQSGANIANFSFNQSSQSNNIAFQMFDYNESEFSKMVMLDTGDWPREDPFLEPIRVIWAGKIVRDPIDEQLRYVNVFTVVLHNDE